MPFLDRAWRTAWWLCSEAACSASRMRPHTRQYSSPDSSWRMMDGLMCSCSYWSSSSGTTCASMPAPPASSAAAAAAAAAALLLQVPSLPALASTSILHGGTRTHHCQE
ncbi:hypothetical protein EYF80_034259 [Liparis tanakae]|uniref:Uncharacterized protein n=1 Tax=Liparis tanakae TaxID=230148 RepID=A0A4Z2GPM8_9TELE|nr:hypothetical protein EYF80_034259 [Liparis tanakae]